MRISPQAVKSKGKITSWRFVYYDKEAKRPRYLRRSDYPELKSIKDKEAAVDFANKWNAKIEEKKAKFKAKRKQEMFSEDFEFIKTVEEFKTFQKDFEKCYIYTVAKVEYMLNKLICCLLYTSPSPRDQRGSRMPSSA